MLTAIVGPTAVGKTAVAIAVAERLHAEIISADSMAIYKGMNIGTAKPTAEEQRQAAFHLIDVVEPDERYTVADFQNDAVRVADSILAEDKIPLLTGGTGLYIRAVIDGLDIPSAPPNRAFRDRMSQLAAAQGKESVHGLLEKVDPATAARLHPNDLKRVVRALEVYEETGATVSSLHPQKGERVPRYPTALQFGLRMNRDALYRRIEERVDEQVRAGLIEEVASLLAKGYDTNLPAMQGLGYKEIAAHLSGELSFEEAIGILKQNTRRFAKRQLTWFRADERIQWIDVTELSATDTADRVVTELRRLGAPKHTIKETMDE